MLHEVGGRNTHTQIQKRVCLNIGLLKIYLFTLFECFMGGTSSVNTFTLSNIYNIHQCCVQWYFQLYYVMPVLPFVTAPPMPSLVKVWRKP